jgi:hypothetical protein
MHGKGHHSLFCAHIRAYSNQLHWIARLMQVVQDVNFLRRGHLLAQGTIQNGNLCAQFSLTHSRQIKLQLEVSIDKVDMLFLGNLYCLM